MDIKFVQTSWTDVGLRIILFSSRLMIICTTLAKQIDQLVGDPFTFPIHWHRPMQSYCPKYDTLPACPIPSPTTIITTHRSSYIPATSRFHNLPPWQLEAARRTGATRERPKQNGYGRVECSVGHQVSPAGVGRPVPLTCSRCSRYCTRA